MKKLSIAMAVVAALLVTLLIFAKGNTISWVPYHATYRETSVHTYASGRSETIVDQTIEKFRDDRGWLLEAISKNGERTTGDLYQGDQPIRLNYHAKTAVFLPKNAHRLGHQHPNPIPDPPVGTTVLAGFPFVGYPIHFTAPDNGTIWMDFPNDIIGKVESHMKLPDGVAVHYVTELTALEIGPVDASALEVPADFTKSTLPLSQERAAASCKNGQSAHH